MAALGKYKTEIIGISAEVAIADEFGVSITPEYRLRADSDIIAMTRKVVPEAFERFDIPRPIKHIAEKQNPVDFVLLGEKTLSVKSNQKKLGKVAPQNVGQPTAATFWSYFYDFADGVIPDDYKGKAAMFKRVAIERIDELLCRYWDNMFDCDKLLQFYDFLDGNGNLFGKPEYIVFEKSASPTWDKNKFSFTQSEATWNESCTVKYHGVSIGEFQVHNNRNCFKFRFNMDAIASLTKLGLIGW
jgi:hypothetical protein